MIAPLATMVIVMTALAAPAAGAAGPLTLKQAQRSARGALRQQAKVNYRGSTKLTSCRRSGRHFACIGIVAHGPAGRRSRCKWAVTVTQRRGRVVALPELLSCVVPIKITVSG